MKIMWHSGAPWEPTGYGTQTAIWTRYLAAQGHEVQLSARSSLMYAKVGHPAPMPDGTVKQLDVLPSAPFFGPTMPDEMLPLHVQVHKPDLVIILFDMWSFGIPSMVWPQVFPDTPVAAWMPIDCAPVDQQSQVYLKDSRFYPVAMSEFGRDELGKLGYACGYVPHGIDTKRWTPLPAVRAKIREQFQIPEGSFVVGINATCTDPTRKGLFEQMAAFAQFRERHPNAMLMLHTLWGFKHGFNAREVAIQYGLPSGCIRYSPQYQYLTGGIPADHMMNWYNALDVLSNCSWGEGFGLPAIEAQACGVPVVLADNSTSRQLVGPGWLVETTPHWNGTHAALWGAPVIESIVDAYEDAYKTAGDRREAAWEFAAEHFDVDVVGPMWEPVLREATGQ